MKDETMKESDLSDRLKIEKNLRDSEITNNKEFVKINFGDNEGTHWTCFHLKDNNPCYLIALVDLR